MAAPGSGPTKRKFTNGDVMACFTEEHRRQVGKIELSAAEITEILNEQVLEDTEVTRQAVSKRLKDLEGGKIQRHQHGRSYLYTRSDDLDRLFREPEPVTTAPAPGGRPPKEKEETEDTGFSLRSWLSSDRQQMSGRDLPGLAIMLIVVGVFGYLALRALGKAFETFGDDDVVKDGKVHLGIESGAALVLTITLFFVSAAAVAYFVAAPALTAIFAANAIWGVFTLLAIPIVTRVLAYGSVVVSTKTVAFARGVRA
jgi:hypothetical protein